MKRTMEYPFKDLLPIDEVLEREGYYNDWTHLDPEVFYSLTQISEYIKTKGYGVDVRLLISQLAEHFGLRVTQITDAMNEFNDLKPKAELSVSQSAEALTKSQSALDVANSADTLSKSVQEQFNQVVIDGDSSVEAAQARVDASGVTKTTLKQRLDDDYTEVTTQLAQTEQQLTGRGVDVLYPPAPYVGAKTDGSDSTVAIQNLLNAFGSVHIPDNTTLNVHGTIEMWQYHKMTLGKETFLIKPSTADNDEPVIWMKSSYASLSGSGLATSQIKSERRTPFGVVVIGYKGATDTEAKNVLYNTIRDVAIYGRTRGGETDGVASIALYLCNNELNGLASYFNSVNNVFLAYANVGLQLEGFANANIISNIQFIEVGNNKQLNGGAIKFKETDGKHPLDNIINNVFHHKSLNAITLNLDGRATYNTITNVVSEQGGTSATSVKAISGATANMFTLIQNVPIGFDAPTDFTQNNTVVAGADTYGDRVVANKLRAGNPIAGSASSLDVSNSTGKEIARMYGTDTLTGGLIISLNRDDTDPNSVLIEHTSGNRSIRQKVTGVGRHKFETSGGVVAIDNNARYSTPSGTIHGECTGSPEGVITAKVGSTMVRTDGGIGSTFYVKESGTGNAGWVAK